MARAEFVVRFTAVQAFDDHRLKLSLMDKEGQALGLSEADRTNFKFKIPSETISNQFADSDFGFCFTITTAEGRADFVVVDSCVDNIAKLKIQGGNYVYNATLLDQRSYAARQRGKVEDILSRGGTTNRDKARILEIFEDYVGRISDDTLHAQDLNLLARIVKHFRKNPSFDRTEYIALDFLANPAAIDMVAGSDTAVGRLSTFASTALRSDTGTQTTADVRKYLAQLYLEYLQLDPNSYAGSQMLDDTLTYYKALFGFGLALSGHGETPVIEEGISYQGKDALRLFFENCEGLAAYGKNDLARACLQAASELDHLVDDARITMADARTISSKIGGILDCSGKGADAVAAQASLLRHYYEAGACDGSDGVCQEARACFR